MSQQGQGDTRENEARPKSWRGQITRSHPSTAQSHIMQIPKFIYLLSITFEVKNLLIFLKDTFTDILEGKRGLKEKMDKLISAAERKLSIPNHYQHYHINQTIRHEKCIF